LRLLQFANFSNKTLHIGLIRRDGRLEIHIYDEPDKTRIEVPAMQRVPVDATPDIEACTVDGSLQYAIHGHCSGLELQPPSKAGNDGPVFRFYDAGQ